jgi:hypothetical protein
MSIFVYSKLVFNEVGGNAHELTRYIINELDNNEKEMLAKDISLDEISKVIKILKPYQSVIKKCCSLYTDLIIF